MIYVALLRGINIGGRNKIDMKALKLSFERVGMRDVVTYINTGNIIFTTSDTSRKLITKKLEEVITDDFDLNIKVLLRSFDEFELVINALPDSWANDQLMKSDVLFLWESAGGESTLEKLEKTAFDTVIYVAETLLWSVDRKNQLKSGMQKLAKNKLYKLMTVRNVNTTRKIWELMQAV